MSYRKYMTMSKKEHIELDLNLWWGLILQPIIMSSLKPLLLMRHRKIVREKFGKFFYFAYLCS